MRIILLIFLLFISMSIFGQQMRIGVLTSYNIKKISLQSVSGSYDVIGDTSLISTVISGRKLELSIAGGKVVVHLGGAESFKASKVLLLPQKTNSSLLYSPIEPVVKKRTYEDALEVTIRKGVLQFVNIVDMKNYLSGVVESEGGGGRHIEYYKVQALMSRTYALKNKRRHIKDGYELCDGVHCQAYHNKLKHTPEIREAVEATGGEVIVDYNNKLVTTYFSANCGGQTCDASYVWNNSVPYLSSFIDTFCIHTKQATWSKRISKHSWTTFLSKQYGVTEAKYGDLIYNFDQDYRKAFFIHPSLGIPLRDLRKKFKLKSTFFSTELVGDQVVISGKGFGHGVGLCQEGAMGMAKSGYNYKQIAFYYFNRVKVIDYYKSQYFKQKESQGIGTL